LHGFTHTSHSSRVFQDILAVDHQIAAFDLPGHGGSVNVTATLDETASLLAEEIPFDEFDLAGYSFGGRVALHLAGRLGPRLRRLVVLSASPGLSEEAARRERRAQDERLAERAEELGTAGFLHEWLGQPLFADVVDDSVERATRHDGPVSGLANSLRFAGTGTQRPLLGELATLRGPNAVRRRYARRQVRRRRANHGRGHQTQPGSLDRWGRPRGDARQAHRDGACR
jgi:pimeloyl-ACP methyl ester carboxylesterase